MHKSHRSSNKLSSKAKATSSQVRQHSRNFLRNFHYVTVFVLSAIISLVFSSYVYASSYELIFNHDLPVAGALTHFKLSDVMKKVSLGRSSLGEQLDAYIGDQGEPQELRIPKSDSRIFLLPALVEKDGQFLIRANSGHFVFTSKAKNGQLGNLVVYLKRDWRSLPQTATFGVDDNLFIDTKKEWRYMYRITDSVKGVDARNYVAQEITRPSLIVIVESNNDIELYRAELSSLQSIQR